MSYQLSPVPPRGIVFHQTYRWLFSEPEVLPASAGIFGPQAGVYAILTDDIRIGPRPFRVLYFGEAENVRARATTGHETCAVWRREAGYGTLYRALHWMPASDQTQRQFVESTLIAAYDPPCNQRLSFDFSKLFDGKSRVELNMAQVTVRVELHHANYLDYEKLHAAMERTGFSRLIQSNTGVTYRLPTAEYNCDEALTRQQVLDAAEKAAAMTGKNAAILVTESNCRTWTGLERA